MKKTIIIFFMIIWPLTTAQAQFNVTDTEDRLYELETRKLELQKRERELGKQKYQLETLTIETENTENGLNLEWFLKYTKVLSGIAGASSYCGDKETELDSVKIISALMKTAKQAGIANDIEISEIQRLNRNTAIENKENFKRNIKYTCKDLPKILSNYKSELKLN